MNSGRSVVGGRCRATASRFRCRSSSLRPLLFLLTLSSLMPASAMSQTDKSLEHAKAIIKAAPLIDGHNDLPWEIRTSKTAPLDVDAYDLRQTTPGHTDLARLGGGRGRRPVLVDLRRRAR